MLAECHDLPCLSSESDVKKQIPSVLVFLLYPFTYMWNDKLWGSFLSGQVWKYVCARGWEGKGGGFPSEEPLASKYDANSNWGEVVLGGIWKKLGVKMTR